MTRRITLAILLTVWATLIAGGVTAYWTALSVLVADLDATLAARAAAQLGASASQVPADDRMIVQDAVGRTLARPTTCPAGAPVIVRADFARLADGRLERTVTLRLAGATPGAASVVTYTTPAEALERLLTRLSMALSLLGLVGGAGAGLLAVRISRSTLRPLRRTADEIGAIDESNLDRRIDVTRLPAELAPMAHRLNEMLRRLEEAFTRRRRFLADASHELRTPLAALMTTIEVSLRRPRDADVYRRTLETCLADVAVLHRLVDRLMERVRSDQPEPDEPLRALDITALLDECAAMAAALGADRGLSFAREYPPDLAGRTQPHRLRSIVMNLLANAVEYNRPGGSVTLAVRREASVLHLRVSDTGQGITAQDLPYVFQPFHRGDRARSPSGGHLGLGLSLVQSHANALGGDCRIHSGHGVGTTVDVTVIVPQDAAPPDVPSLRSSMLEAGKPA